MKLTSKKNERGLGVVWFEDGYGLKCSLQKSSLASPDCVWLGVHDLKIDVLMPGKGWQPVAINPDWLGHTRMHLTRKQVKALLPFLKNFMKTGDI